MHHERAGRRRPIGEMSVPKCAKLLTMTKPDEDEIEFGVEMRRA
jgi:hypothetical protein